MTASRVTRCTVLGLVILLALPVRDAAAFFVDIADLVNQPRRYDQQTVTVTGTAGPVRNISMTVESTNQTVRFVGFLVYGSGTSVFVIHHVPGGPAPASGARLEVTGVFHGHWLAIQPTRSYTLK